MSSAMGLIGNVPTAQCAISSVCRTTSSIDPLAGVQHVKSTF